MSKISIARFVAVVAIVAALAGWAAFISAGRVQAATTGGAWGDLLKDKCDVQIQFMDAATVPTSPWYNGTVVGYDGNMITFVNTGQTDRIYIPISAIRQLMVVPPSQAPAANATSTGK